MKKLGYTEDGVKMSLLTIYLCEIKFVVGILFIGVGISGILISLVYAAKSINYLLQGNIDSAETAMLFATLIELYRH